MTAPRQILPGVTYLITRRCSEQRFFLRPSREATKIFRYALAVASERYGIVLHAFCVMSNHFHFVHTDPHAHLPDFHRDLDSIVARAMNDYLGRWDGFWDRRGYSAVQLETPGAIVEKMVYVLANPVAAALVRRGAEWPGLWSGVRGIGKGAVAVERPSEFFRARGPTPPTAELAVQAPSGFDAATLRAGLEEGLRRAEDRAAAELGAQGRSFLGAGPARAQNPNARPAKAGPRRTLSPRVATRDTWKRIEALWRLVDFREAYRRALVAWRGGARDVAFPPGTWLMRVQHGACCAAAAT
jgi:REP element-mobilizing transposase RayT